jgi:hypothetical protein
MSNDLTRAPDSSSEDTQTTPARAGQSQGGGDSPVGTGIAVAAAAVLGSLQALYSATDSIPVTVIGAILVVVIAVTLTIVHRRSR